METGLPKPQPPHVSPKGMWITKFCIRILSFIFCVALLGVTGTIASGGTFSIVPLLCIAPSSIVAACWDIAEGICLLARGGHRGIHPGANVALDLLIWLGFLAATLLLGLGIAGFGLLVGYASSYDNYSGYSYGGYNYSSVTSATASILSMGQAILGLAATLIVLHFTTFVIACYETNVRNRKKRATTIIYTNAPPMMAPYNGQVLNAPQAAYYPQGQAMPQQMVPQQMVPQQMVPQQMKYPAQVRQSVMEVPGVPQTHSPAPVYSAAPHEKSAV